MKGYVSSYLFTRICLEKICENDNIFLSESINIYLNLLRESHKYDQELVCYLANELVLDANLLCETKSYQLELIKNINLEYQKNKENGKSLWFCNLKIMCYNKFTFERE